MVRRRRFTLWLWALPLLCCLVSPPLAGPNDLFPQLGINPLKETKKMPNMTLEDLRGGKCELKTLEGKVIFLNFWATWCGPCKEEMPSMEQLYQQFKDKGFVFLAISVDYEGTKRVRDYIEKHRYGFPVLLDQKSKTLDLFDVKQIPTTFIIDKQGRMLGKAVGPRNWNKPEVASLVNVLLRTSDSK